MLDTHLSLPLPAGDLIASVQRFHMLTTSQLRRLHYRQGSARSREIRCSRHLKRLYDLGLLKRIWGYYNDRAEYVYLPADSKARRADMHTLDINELYVRLVGTSMSLPIFDPEPWCHVQVGHMTLKPDAYLDTGRMRYFIEMDESSQYRSVISQKMRRYASAYERWSEPTFPLVVFVCHDTNRMRFLEAVAKSQALPALFRVVYFHEVVWRLLPES